MRPPNEGSFDPRIFEALVEEYADRVYNIALRITNSAEEAEDATQETFLSAYQHRESFRAEASVSTWLYRIAVNAALQGLRKQRPVEYLEATGQDQLQVTDWSEDLHRRIEQQELHETIERGISLLPDDFRTALVLRDVEGLSATEAAEVLEVSEANLKSRLHRGRLLLRQYLADYLEGR